MRVEGQVNVTVASGSSSAAHWIASELAANGIHGTNVRVVSSGWLPNPRSVTIDVTPGPGQSARDVAAVVNLAFQNMAAVYPDAIWDVGEFSAVTAGSSIGGSVGGGGGVVYDGNEYIYQGGNLATVTVKASDGDEEETSFVEDIEKWLKEHQTEAMMVGLALVIVLTRR